MTAEWMPVNPCKGCEYDNYCPIFNASRFTICEKYRTYKSNLAAISKLLEYLLDMNEYWDSEGNAMPLLDRIQQMLKQLEATNLCFSNGSKHSRYCYGNDGRE